MDDASKSDSAFAQALGDLKRRGSNLLLVGTPSPEPHAAACERLLGDDSVRSRQRLFVVTDGTYERTTACEGAVDERVITHATSTRSAAAATAGPTTPAGQRDATGPDLGDLAAAIDGEIDALEAELEPGELRLCFDSLTPILEEHDRGEAVRFLHALGNRVRATQGMAHYHLPADRDVDAVRAVEPAFDAVIELRATCDGPEQRWHILEEDLDSGWLQL